jgi:hypothetical protein
MAEIVTGVVSNVVSTLFKWIWSQKSKPKVPPGRDLTSIKIKISYEKNEICH